MLPTYILISLFVAFLWGLAPIIQKHLLKKFDRFSLMLFFSTVYFICLLLCLPFYHLRLIRDVSILEIHDIALIALTAIGTSFLANVLILQVIKEHDSYIVSALESVAPLFTLFFVYYFLNEKINILGVLGVILVVLGIFCIALNDASFKMEEFVGFR
jgi:drug/metabolite transporter (DMT)-like permease